MPFIVKGQSLSCLTLLQDRQMVRGVRQGSGADMLWGTDAGLPQLRILTRDQGRDPQMWRGRQREDQDEQRRLAISFTGN